MGHDVYYYIQYIYFIYPTNVQISRVDLRASNIDANIFSTVYLILDVKSILSQIYKGKLNKKYNNS